MAIPPPHHQGATSINNQNNQLDRFETELAEMQSKINDASSYRDILNVERTHQNFVAKYARQSHRQESLEKLGNQFENKRAELYFDHFFNPPNNLTPTASNETRVQFNTSLGKFYNHTFHSNEANYQYYDQALLISGILIGFDYLRNGGEFNDQNQTYLPYENRYPHKDFINSKLGAAYSQDLREEILELIEEIKASIPDVDWNCSQGPSLSVNFSEQNLQLRSKLKELVNPETRVEKAIQAGNLSRINRLAQIYGQKIDFSSSRYENFILSLVNKLAGTTNSQDLATILNSLIKNPNLSDDLKASLGRTKGKGPILEDEHGRFVARNPGNPYQS